jgi:hypothetical protein
MGGAGRFALDFGIWSYQAVGRRIAVRMHSSPRHNKTYRLIFFESSVEIMLTWPAPCPAR